MNSLTSPHFKDDDAARVFIGGLRWPNGPVCHHCKETERRYVTKREGRFRCGNPECRKDYSVTTGTVMESSHIPLHKWMLGFYLMSSSKKGMSAHQLHRTLGITYKSAWFMCHRIREAMRAGGLEPLGGEGKIVEADETYYGRTSEPKPILRPRRSPYTKAGWEGKGACRPIVSLVERGGNVRSFYVAHADKVTVTRIVKENIHKETRLHTDESRLYGEATAHFAAHKRVKHSAGEYVRGDVHTNTIEGFFSIFKRGMRGVYQHCKEKHLHRYLAEFDFRYNARKITDGERAALAIMGIEGKRLTYRQAD